MRAALASAFALGLLLSVGAAKVAAADEAPRVTVLPFGGEGGAEVQQVVVRALSRHGFDLVSAEEFRATAARLASSVEGTEVIRAVASELRLVAVVMGKVTGTRKALHARVVVRDGRDGEVLEEAAFVGPGRGRLRRVVEKSFWKKLGGSFRASRTRGPGRPPSSDDPFAAAPGPGASATPAPSAEPTPPPLPEPLPVPEAPSPPPEEPVVVQRPRPRPRREAPVDAEGPRAGNTAQPTAWELWVSSTVFYRQLSYLNDLNDNLSEFRTKSDRPAFAISGSATWLFRMAFPRLGLSAWGEQALGLVATTSNNLTYHTSSGDFWGAILLGVPSHFVTVDLSLGAGQQGYAFLPQEEAISRPRPVPDTTYTYLRAGLALHIYTDSPLSIFAAGYYRHVLSAGDIQSNDWFPSARVLGIEASVGLSYRLMSSLEARLHGDMRLYRLSMDPVVGGAHITDGATDQYWTAGLSLVALFGGR